MVPSATLRGFCKDSAGGLCVGPRQATEGRTLRLPVLWVRALPRFSVPTAPVQAGCQDFRSCLGSWDTRRLTQGWTSAQVCTLPSLDPHHPAKVW